MSLTLKQSDVSLILSALDAEGDCIADAIYLVRKTGTAETDEAVKTLRRRAENIGSLRLAFQLATSVTLTRHANDEEA